MSPETTSAASGLGRPSSSHLSIRLRARVATLSTLLLLVFYIVFLSYQYQTSVWRWKTSSNLFPTTAVSSPPTNLSHLVFGIVSSWKLLEQRKAYVEAWWRPNVTRGYLFLDKDPEDRTVLCPDTCPTLRINQDISAWKIYNKKDVNPLRQVRQVRSIIETFRQQDKDVRWYVRKAYVC